jgi:hypothetical protein
MVVEDSWTTSEALATRPQRKRYVYFLCHGFLPGGIVADGKVFLEFRLLAIHNLCSL